MMEQDAFFFYSPTPPPLSLSLSSALVARYRSQYNIRFGGIRKPRFGNSTLLVMARENGWLMGQMGVPGATPDKTRNLNYSMPAVREFYSHANDLFLHDGVLLWWNDVRSQHELPSYLPSYLLPFSPLPPTLFSPNFLVSLTRRRARTTI